jgi:hypothetical protein
MVMPKYLLCFRGADHKHDALREGLTPISKAGPVKYQGQIVTDTSLPMTQLLPIAAGFPLRQGKEGKDETTVDVVLIPLPDEPEELMEAKIKGVTESKPVLASDLESDDEPEMENAGAEKDKVDLVVADKKKSAREDDDDFDMFAEIDADFEKRKAEHDAHAGASDKVKVDSSADDDLEIFAAIEADFEKKKAEQDARASGDVKRENAPGLDDDDEGVVYTSKSPFVNTSSVQKLDALAALRSKKAGFADAYEDLAPMFESKEVAAVSVPRENVVASLKCERTKDSFKITSIEMQDDKVVNPDFITSGYKDKLNAYLKKYFKKSHVLPHRETTAYRGFFVEKEGVVKDFRHVHKDARYQMCYEEVVRYCNKNKIAFEHEDNLELMERYRDRDFDLKQFCKELKADPTKKMGR